MLALDDLEVLERGSADEGFEAVMTTAPEVMIVSTRIGEDDGEGSGFELLRRVREAGSHITAVIITGKVEVGEALRALRLGAADYLAEAELSADRLSGLIDVTPRAKRRERESSARSMGAIIGSTPGIERVRWMIDRVAESDKTVLIRGETGTGKEMIARALHVKSARRNEPFVAVNCSALPGALIESMIFGHERGAFTGADRRVRGQLELAGAGTLLLDEIAEMPRELQSKLLRVLEDRRFRPLGSETELPVRARILAATHVDLETCIATGTFREDLYYRLNVISVYMPSLVERAEDLGELLVSLTQELPVKLRFSPEAVNWLKRRSWPGNVRELKNVVERLALLSDDELIDVSTLEELAFDRPLLDSVAEVDRIARALLALPERLGSKLRVMERAVLHHAVEACGGNKAAAARLIGVDRKVLERRWDRHVAEDDG
jgi:DNA-binding NtrC family response regulator